MSHGASGVLAPRKGPTPLAKVSRRTGGWIVGSQPVGVAGTALRTSRSRPRERYPDGDRSGYLLPIVGQMNLRKRVQCHRREGGQPDDVHFVQLSVKSPSSRSVAWMKP